MIVKVKIVAAITGLALYLVFKRGCCQDDHNCSIGLIQCAWAEIKGFLRLD